MEAEAGILKHLLKFAFALLISLYAQVFPPAACGQGPAAEDLAAVTIEHKLPNLSDSDPGSELVLHALLKGTKQTSLKMRCFFSRDGKLLELPLERSFRNAYDVPTYEFKTAAPLAGASYYFVLYRGSSLPLVSERYLMERECLPKIGLTDLKPQSEEESPEKHLLTVREQARGLEQDLADYETAARLVEELKLLLGDQQ